MARVTIDRDKAHGCAGPGDPFPRPATRDDACGQILWCDQTGLPGVTQCFVELDTCVADIAQTALRVFRKAAPHEVANRRRRCRRERDPIRFAFENRRERVRRRLSWERAASGQQLIEHAAKGPDICPLVDRVTARLLW